ncbi:galacturonan 1,4-alpha-galacturonidase [Sarracenia purpurea var. burkii]
MKPSPDVVLCLCSQAFKDAWKLACSSSSQSQVEIPVGNTYLVRPIDFGGPCQSKLTLKISGTIIAPKDPDVWDGLNPQKWLYFHGALVFHRCENLIVRNLMMVNSQQMHLAFTNCVRVSASHLKVLAPGSSPNTDGIHISASTLVEIKRSVVRTG